MSETLRIISSIAVVVALLFVCIAVPIGLLIGFWDYISQPFTNIVLFAGPYIRKGRELVNNFVWGPELIDISLLWFVFSKPVLWIAKFSFKVGEYIYKGW